MPDIRLAQEAVTLAEGVAAEAGVSASELAREATELLGRTAGSMRTPVTEAQATLSSVAVPHIAMDGLTTERPSYSDLLKQMRVKNISVLDLLSTRWDAQKARFLGKGRHHSVFTIPELDAYAMRVKLHQPASSFSPLEAVVDPLPEMNIGQPIAQIGGAQILKRVSGNPYGPAYFSEKLSADVIDADYAAAIREAARMPQSAFDKFAHDLAVTRRAGLEFDPINPNNILLDKGAERFNLVDFTAKPEPDNSLFHMLYGLSAPEHFASPEAFQSVEREALSIIQKSVRAAQRAGLPPDRGFVISTFRKASSALKQQLASLV